MTDFTPPSWQRIQELCELVEALPAGLREARLRELEGDPQLRDEVLGLLQSLTDEAEQQRIFRATAFAQPARDGAALPDVIGGVRIVAHIGSGGSGDFFRGVRTVNGAEQAVAVKRFHTHRATASDLERFAREQRMLATLTHPAIVRFIDAGVETDGRPYLVMELADGLPIVEYCDRHSLTVTARLQLFGQVCDAVRSAHAHNVLHLDLKPSNVLVTDAGGQRHVKLVDFGTAKLVDPSLDATRTEPLTVQYASPERLRGDPVTEACDIYGLGLMLFELSSGGWPYRKGESLVAIAERATGTASTVPLPQSATEEAAGRRDVTLDRLKAALRGDLDAVTAKALAYEPGQRYTSVEALGNDVRRHLSGEPILARAPHFGYVASRWGRRYRWPLASAAVALVAVVSALWFTSRDAGGSAGRIEGTFAAEARTSMRRPQHKIGFQMFDDFMSPARNVITGVAWKGVYTSNVDNAPAPAPTAVAFLVGIYADVNGEPNQLMPLHASVYPIARTAETREGEQLAPCGRGTITCGWSHYRYRVSFDRPFVAEPGVRYWMSIMAHIGEARTAASQPGVFWNWAGMLGTNRRSVLIRDNGTRAEFELDRLYSLTVEAPGVSRP